MKKTEEEFRRACDKFVSLDNLGRASCRFGAQFMRITGMDKLMTAEVRSKIRKTPKPKGWQKNLFLKLRKTVFKELVRDKIGGCSTYFRAGKIIGVARNIAYSDANAVNEADARAVFSETFGFPPEQGKPLRKLKEKAEEYSPSQLVDFAKGLQAGAKVIFNDDGNLVHCTSATEIQVTLLLFNEIVQYAPNIYALWSFFKSRRGDEFKHSPESLEKICRRAGIPLALKATSRSKSGHAVDDVSGQSDSEAS